MRTTIVDRACDVSPWTGPEPLATANPACPIYLRDKEHRRDLEGRLEMGEDEGGNPIVIKDTRTGNSFDLKGGLATFTFSGPGQWRFAFRTPGRIPMLRRPTLMVDMSFEGPDAEVRWWDGKRSREYQWGDRDILQTDFAYLDPLGKFDNMGTLLLQVTQRYPGIPAQGSVTFHRLQITAEEETPALARAIALHDARGDEKPTYAPIEVDSDRTEPLDLHVCEGEPVAIRVRFREAIDQCRLRLALYPMLDRRWRWEVVGDNGVPYLVDDPWSVWDERDRETGSKPSLPISSGLPLAAALVTFTAHTGRTRTDRFWSNTVSTKKGEIRILSGGTVIHAILVRVHVYKYPIMQARPSVEAGCFVSGFRYGRGTWDETHRWMTFAGITRATNPVKIGYRGDHDWTDFNECEHSRDLHGPLLDPILSAALFSDEIWRYYRGSDAEGGDLDGSWIGPSIDRKANTFGPHGLALSKDEAAGDELRLMGPLWDRAIAKGLYFYASIHPYMWDEVPQTREAIKFWVMTERNPEMSARLRENGKMSGKYGYPFADIHGYDVHRREFWRCLESGVDVYFVYSLNDIQGTAFGSGRKMGVLIPGATADGTGVVETTSAIGYVAGVVDMRYVAYLRKVATAMNDEAALDYVESLDAKADPDGVRAHVLAEVGRLCEAGYRG